MSDLFEHAAAHAAKTEAMTRAEINADAYWSATMLRLVEQVCRAHNEFTADAVFALYDAMPVKPRTHDTRAFGPVMKRAAKAGFCIETGRVVKSTRASNHRRPVAVWKSLIARGA